MKSTLLVAVALAAVAVNSVAHAESDRRQDAGKSAVAAAKAEALPGVDMTTTASITGGSGKGLLARLGGDEPAAKVDLKAVKGGLPAIVTRYAKEYGVPVALAHAVVTVESNFRPHVTGRAGEIGLMQIKPATARMMGYSGSAKGLYDPETNVKYGMKYLAKAHELGGGDTCGTILRYNAGHAAKRMNRISSAYCTKVKRVIGS
ncbi:transglycosylase SLT domain-containing protein [Aquibium sp. ELW1220]|jgi:soluble lytic murein transglycosylase-like protein|uniref:lytic transglycosylase domain-containing protein n=1 Tax=Aquibium sp. ELW1220 TaxID=2976766 RepID=UPI0025B23466|nr:transglycosylase SLT domain-containing protein [Aquibium sp. ELW1220]MDN2580580.1 transglycosylase SLT domain-containing protein [Aquibium sp. ELW1220]